MSAARAELIDGPFQDADAAEAAASADLLEDASQLIGDEGAEAHNHGQGGIRTHGTLAGTPVFETGRFNRSRTCPYGETLETPRR